MGHLFYPDQQTVEMVYLEREDFSSQFVLRLANAACFKLLATGIQKHIYKTPLNSIVSCSNRVGILAAGSLFKSGFANSLSELSLMSVSLMELKDINMRSFLKIGITFIVITIYNSTKGMFGILILLFMHSCHTIFTTDHTLAPTVLHPPQDGSGNLGRPFSTVLKIFSPKHFSEEALTKCHFKDVNRPPQRTQQFLPYTFL